MQPQCTRINADEINGTQRLHRARNLMSRRDKSPVFFICVYLRVSAANLSSFILGRRGRRCLRRRGWSDSAWQILGRRWGRRCDDAGRGWSYAIFVL
jgi:retron-type reverse transcriptase